VRLHELAKVPGEVIDLRRCRRPTCFRATIKRAKVILSGTIEKAVVRARPQA
jgi:hypothetical protein